MKLPFNIQENIVPAFVTSIGRFAIPNAAQINPGLIKAIMDVKSKDEGTQRSNIHGWHSKDDLFDWPVPEVKELQDSARSALMHMIAITSRIKKFKAQMAFECWANVSEAGAYNAMHMHPFNHWSGCYYVQTGVRQKFDGRSGCIEFMDPRGAIAMMKHPGDSGWGGSMTMPPIEGSMLLFPAWFNHAVHTHDSDKPRISIAFNARITAFQNEDPPKG